MSLSGGDWREGMKCEQVGGWVGGWVGGRREAEGQSSR